MASKPRISMSNELENRAVVAIVPDRGSRGGQYRRLAQDLGARGIATCAIDLRRWRRIDGYVRDTRTMMSFIRERLPRRPLFLLGHGTGAVVACLWALDRKDELAGLICEAIVLEPRRRAMTRRILGGLSRLLIRLPGTAARRTNHDLLRESLGELSAPLLVLHGSEDMAALVPDSEYLHGHAGSADKTLQVFEGYHHDLVNDRGHEIVREKTCQWIEARLDSRAGRRQIGIEYINEQS